MPRHINRWRGETGYGNPIQSYSCWLDNVDIMRQFIRNRPAKQREHIIDYFRLRGLSQVELNISHASMGCIKINEVENVRENGTRPYFKDIPLILEAIPKVGYQFVKWQGLQDSLQNPISMSFSFSFREIKKSFPLLDSYSSIFSTIAS